MMTGARQTMMSWARVIDSFDSVPAIYKNPYQTLVGNTCTLPYTLFAPAQGSPRIKKHIDRLLCTLNDTFYVLELAGEQVITTGYRFQDICSLELGNILLYSWFSISGRTNTGTDAALTVEFNEANLCHFEPFFRKMRPASAVSNQSELKVEQAKFDYLAIDNFKFVNFARESLVCGEKVIQTLYQPQNRKKVISVLGHSFFRTIFLAHLSILTDKEVILIGDAESITENKRSKYGGIWRYLPLRSIVSVALEEQPNDLLSFTFHVFPDIQVKRLFDSSRLREIEALKKALETLLG
jgi:hypothetical protein